LGEISDMAEKEKNGASARRQKRPDGRASIQAQRKADQVLVLMRKRYPAPETHLQARNPWELLVATVLAAQCTDARVNLVTPHLFARWPDPASLAEAGIEDLEACIRSTGFYHSKAKHLLAAAKRVRDAYKGKVPGTMADLITLPGVARKTANVVLWGAFGINEGIAVDTHVGRIAYRLGLASTKDPVRTEQELMALFPREEWGDVNHRLVWFGRDVCDARKPLCGDCELAGFCDKRDVC
jgi:endonuclease-3